MDALVMLRAKVRIRFRKDGALRLISHHDLMRCFERMLRRAQLPYHSTSGFNPKPRLIFASALPLGVVGSDEVVELELDADLAPEEVRDRLAREAPAGLEILSARAIDSKATAHVRRVCYRVPLATDHTDGLSERIATLLASSEHWVERDRPERRRYNLRPFLDSIRRLPEALEMGLFVTPGGAARPEEVLAALGLHDLVAAGVSCERTHVELEDEVARPLPAGSASDR